MGYRLEFATVIRPSKKKKAQKLEAQIDGLLDGIVDKSTPNVFKAFEMRTAKLETQKRLLEEKTSKTRQTQHSFDDTL